MNLKNLIRLARGCLTMHADTCGKETYILSFMYRQVVVTIRIVLNDRQTGADVTITNMTTLPYSEIKKGFGGHALSVVLAWMESEGKTSCTATQVQTESEDFWIKQSFLKLGNETNDFVYKP